MSEVDGAKRHLVAINWQRWEPVEAGKLAPTRQSTYAYFPEHARHKVVRHRPHGWPPCVKIITGMAAAAAAVISARKIIPRKLTTLLLTCFPMMFRSVAVRRIG